MLFNEVRSLIRVYALRHTLFTNHKVQGAFKTKCSDIRNHDIIITINSECIRIIWNFGKVPRFGIINHLMSNLLTDYSKCSFVYEYGTIRCTFFLQIFRIV